METWQESNKTLMDGASRMEITGSWLLNLIQGDYGSDSEYPHLTHDKNGINSW